MATSVETEDLKMVIDPAIALAPLRFSLPPHSIEEKMRAVLMAEVKKKVEEADALVVTHYHYDHVDPKEPEFYGDKLALLKHPRRMINPSQKKRAYSFIHSIKKLAKEISYIDNKKHVFGETRVNFSKPMPHGSTSTRGYVVEVSVRSGKTFLYTSDVQGPLLEEQVEFILAERPEILFVDGPSTYFDSPHSSIDVRKANENLTRIIREADVERIVIDHHLTRDLEYKKKILPSIEAADDIGVLVETAAEFSNEDPNLLEARRRELHGKVKA